MLSDQIYRINFRSRCLKKIYREPLCIGVWYSNSCRHCRCSTSSSDTAGMKVPALVSVPDSVASGLCVVTSVSWDCPPLSGKDEPQHFPTQDAGRVNLSTKQAFFLILLLVNMLLLKGYFIANAFIFCVITEHRLIVTSLKQIIPECFKVIM